VAFVEPGQDGPDPVQAALIDVIQYDRVVLGSRAPVG
jgi:hypothetical protein